MKMTQENMKRFDEMVKNFANENNLFVKINHAFDENETTIVFKQLELNMVKNMLIVWDAKKSLTDACTTIFTYLTRNWNLDDGEVHSAVPEIKNVIYNDPATIVLWEDGTKTVVKCQGGDLYSAELGLAMCIAKKALGNKGNFNEVFKKWVPEEKIDIPICHELSGLGISARDVAECYDVACAAFDKAIEKLKKGLR